METQKLKKEMMRVASLIILFFLLSFSLLAQKAFIGKYSNSTGVKYKTLDLMKGNNFKLTSSVSTDVFISKGYYLIKKDTLLLFYDSLPLQYPISKFAIVNKSDSIFREFGGAYKINDDVVSLTIVVEDYSGNPIKGCNIGFMNSNKPIFGKVSDVNGKVEMYSEGKLIEYITIFGMGYQPLSISMDEFWGYKTLIKVKLGETSIISYNNKYKIVKYSIIKLKNDNISLYPINNPKLDALLKN